MHLSHYLGLVHRAESELAHAFRHVADGHGDEPDVALNCHRMAGQCDRHVERVAPFAQRYGEDASDEPDHLHSELFHGPRTGGLGLLRDLHDLYLMACEVDISWTVIGQAAQGARDDDLLHAVSTCDHDTAIQLAWLRTRMKATAPQALVVAR
jgi:hypothetical protein